MGKKSLLTSTTGSTGDTGQTPPKKKRAVKKKDKQTLQAPPVLPENSAPAPARPVVAQSTTVFGDGRPEPAAVSECASGGSAPVSPRIQENGDDAMTGLIAGAVGCVAFAVLILLIASSMNAGRYYVKESRGAVEIWKGDFSPGGRERLLVLHDAAWDMKKKRFYDKEEALAFASRYYMQRAGDLLAADGVRDYPRILSYVDKAIALNADMGNDDHEAALQIVKKDVQEAAILDSGEPETLPVVARKVTDAGHSLAGLLFEERRK